MFKILPFAPPRRNPNGMGPSALRQAWSTKA
jgi:hypothetical protein